MPLFSFMDDTSTTFKKSFPFRKKKTDNRDDSPDYHESHDAKSTTAARETPSPSNASTNSNAQSQDRSSGASHEFRHAKTMDSQFAPSLGSSATYRGFEASSKDPLGLKVVHRPVGQRLVDIIFVHGLGGSSRMTWSHDRNPDFFWPLKFLPLEPDINEARILTFGYNADFRPGSGKNKMSVLDFAKDLLFDLKHAQDESTLELEDLGMGDRPIIFIVHSMGGLIVKEAYMQGQNDPTYESIIKAISSIIFLSTPHRGTNLADTLNRILQVSFVTSPMQFIAELAAGSQTLQKLNEQFRHAAPKLQIVSFYETRPTTMFKKAQIMVLEKDSSVLGYPGEISKPLDADHHGVCKYASPDDPRYITVRNVLKTLITKAKTKQNPPDTGAPSVASFEEYLSVFESSDADYNFFRDRWTPGTCTWIESNDSFNAWMQDVSFRPRVLWVNGSAASGKSILSSFIINHLVQLGLPCQYFFIRFMSQEKRGLGMLLRSLACQLANSTPAYGDKLRRLEAAAADLKTADSRTIWQWLFRQTLFHLDHGFPLYWVIDGLDEADRPAALIRLLSELEQTTLPLRVLIVSRKTHEISSAFQKLAKQVETDTIRAEGNLIDFRSYIDHEMDLAGDAVYREEVTHQLLNRAKGNFLWLHLAVQRINACHTRPDVERALEELPSGMEALYNRMAASVQSQTNVNDRNLGLNILGWTTCARRLLSVDELGDALENDGVLEIHRTIGDLCGGFVTVDHEGKATMTHETAREYLVRGGKSRGLLGINPNTTNDTLFKRCIARLTDTSLRSQINRNRPPALLSYAMSSWSHHLVHGSVTNPDILEIIMNFLGSPHVLTWIHVAARAKDLRALVTASRHLVEVAFKLRRMEVEESPIQRQAAAVVEGWATDFVKIVGKFGNNLRKHPDAIYKLIPPFCPEDSMIYQQFGRKESRSLQISGFTATSWDDCLARFTLAQGVVASSVIAAGSRIAILTVIRKLSQIIIYTAATFEEQRRITHPERVLTIQSNKLGDLLVSYGYLTTRLWNVATGECLKIIKNPPKRPRPHSILFDEKRGLVLVCFEDRSTRTFSLEDDGIEEYELLVQIDEQSLDDTTVSFPTVTSISPDGNMVAFGYRNHPATVWELEPPMLIGQCSIPLNENDMTTEVNTWGEVFRLAWHPHSGEVIGLNMVGLLFIWDPYEEEASTTVHTGADNFTISADGSLIATGDAVGAVKVYSTADFSMLYQLASQDPVLYICFSTDSRRLYDIRGSYGNVWEPNTLIRLADCSDHNSNSDSHSETESLAKVSLYAEHHFARVDDVIALSGQSVGPLYCYGTEDGIAVLCETGRGKIAELERLTSYISIEYVAWSEDGRLVALVDLSGRLTVKRITRSTEKSGSWDVSAEFDIVIPQEQGHINQVMFHATGQKLLLCTPTILFSIDLRSRSLKESKLESSMSKVKWTNHPTVSDTLLGFGNTKVYVFSWTDLREREVYSYFPPRIGRSSTITAPSFARGHTGSFQNDTETLGRLISCTDSPYILLEISSSTASGHLENQYLLIDVDNMQRDSSEEGSNHDPLFLTYMPLPQEVASRIREPLAFLSRRRLAFLDVDKWICTWRLPVSAPARFQGRKASESGVGAIEQYYFLPGDWVTSNETRLCTITPDGTLLCPKNGDVATVQAAKLRK
ncbi:hypothetical protein F4781DRAFT_428518 [Annulohypoxylon bovei var. microspora]|nr:hypothetical protein F4781DRAFT_428518 [Annulohypoxylon bovei var. microspora]